MNAVSIEYRGFNDSIGDIGGVDATMGDFKVQFDSGAVDDTLACRSCGAAIADWRYTTDKATGQRANGPKVNVVRHVEFHARLGF